MRLATNNALDLSNRDYNPMPANVTHRRIASEAGVSQTTVSFALRDDPKISAEVRAQVKAVAVRLGYRPNPGVASLMAHVRLSRPQAYRATLAFVYTQERKDALQRDEVIRRCYEGARQRAEELGYRMEAHWRGDPEMRAERFAKILESRGIDGIVVGPMGYQMAPGQRLELPWDRLASAAIGRTLHEPALDRACHDNFGSMLLLLDVLRQRGYRRVGLVITTKDDDRVNHLWLAAFLAHSHQHAELSARPPLLMSEWQKQDFERWFVRERPDCVVSTAETPRLWMEELGECVPETVGFATVSWNLGRKACGGIFQRYERLGAEAVNIVLGRLHRNERRLPEDPHEVLVKGEWKEGVTLRSAAAAEKPPAAAQGKRSTRRRAKTRD